MTNDEVGDWVYDRLTEAERAQLADSMYHCCLNDDNEFFDNLGNAGLSTFLYEGDHPTEENMRDMCRQLTGVRFIHDQIQVDWDCLLRNAFGATRERVRGLYIEATGMTDEEAFAKKEADRLAAVEAAREAQLVQDREAWQARLARQKS